MECSVCGIRSAVGACAESGAMLCEECGVECAHCGRIFAPACTHTSSRSGKVYCNACYEERKARRAAAEGASRTDLKSLTGEKEEEAGADAVVLTASAEKPVAPWQWSWYTGGAGLLLILLVLFFPSMRRVPMPGGPGFSTIYFLFVLPLLGIFWAVIGIRSATYFKERLRAGAGILIAAAAIAAGVYAIRTDPARLAAIQAQQEREALLNRTPEELKAARESVLNQYRQR